MGTREYGPPLGSKYICSVEGNLAGIFVSKVSTGIFVITGGLQLDFCEMVCDLRGKYKRNKIFVHTTRQSANQARALQVESELFGCPSINY